MIPADTFDLFYLLDGEERRGPFTLAQMQHMWRTGTISARMTYWQEGLEEWQPVAALVDILEAPRRPELSRGLRESPASANRVSRDEAENPPGFESVKIQTFFFPFIGLFHAINWLGVPHYRGAGGAMLGIFFAASVLWSIAFWLLHLLV